MWAILKVAGALAALALRAVAHDGVTQKYEPVDAASLLDGEPTGKIVKIGGVDTYVALPPFAKKFPKGALLFLTDVFGLPLVNSKLLADKFAKEGFATFAPDYLNGDPVPLDMTGFNITEWLSRHGEDQTTPLLLAVIDGLKKFGVKKFAATGYCFGGLYAMRLAQNNTVAVSVSAHPSLLSIPADIDLLKEKSKVPVEIHSASLDTGFTPALAAVTDGILNGTAPESPGKYKPGYVRYDHVGVVHGFAVRPANASDPFQIAELEAAFYSTVKTVGRHI